MMVGPNGGAGVGAGAGQFKPNIMKDHRGSGEEEHCLLTDEF